MVVLQLTNCPQSLRGDLTKWLLEIAVGVYVGKVSARVRDLLWTRVVETSKSGRAVLVFSANNEQGMDFKIHGDVWEPVDFDGLKLMLRPSPAKLKAKQSKTSEKGRLGFSNAAKFQKAKKFSRIKEKQEEEHLIDNSCSMPEKTETMKLSDSNCSESIIRNKIEQMDEYNFDDTDVGSDLHVSSYVVLDIETTGFSPRWAEITEIGAIKVVGGKIVCRMQSLVKIKKNVTPEITKLTGITDEMLANEGMQLCDVIVELLSFVENLPIVVHNSRFDVSFINAALEQMQMPKLANKIIDTLNMSKRLLKSCDSYKLGELANHLGLVLNSIDDAKYSQHRSLGDCYLTYLLYEKLQKLNFRES